MRFCDKCGAHASPHIPRVRVGDELWCAGCATNNRQTVAAIVRQAEGWSPDDVVRFELGRQYVRQVDNRSLCATHLDHALGRGDPTMQVGPQHEGRCTECAKGQADSSTPHPWNALPGGGIPRQQAQERQPTPHNEGDDWGNGYHEGRWPSRPLKPHTEELGAFVPGIQSMNARSTLPAESGTHMTAPEAVMGSRIAVPMPGMPKSATIRFLGHDSGDGETIFHCPFCGSGQVIARSDGTVECFSGDTRFMTFDGVRTFAETAGTTQKVLTHTGDGGRWVDAAILEFGQRKLWKVTIQRNKRTREIYATEGHRWFTVSGRGARIETLTRNLRSKDTLASVLPHPVLSRSFPSPFGIAHGVVYGDGSRTEKSSAVELWGEKDAQLLGYFIGHPSSPCKTENGVTGVKVRGLPGFFKDRPSLDESIPYLYGWLAGYFAADGTVSRQGQAVLCSARRADLEFVQVLAHRLGIATYGITVESRVGRSGKRLADEATDIFRMEFVGSTVPEDLFLTREHLVRFATKKAKGSYERLRWTVVSVEETDREETVYCASVPETKNFALEDNLLVGNCEFCATAFTVQVQPQMPAFPQTIDGQPQQVPGMPAGGQSANVPPGAGGDPMDPDADPDADPAQQEDGQDNPFPGDADSGGDDSADDDNKPAFLKGSGLLYRTTAGHALDELQMMRHLALQDPNRRTQVLARIRAENGS